MKQDEFADRTEAVRDRLYRTAYLYLGSEADALDAVDEAVYKALRALKQLREPDFFETWLTRILINECHRELRRRTRFSGEDTLPETAGPDVYETLPLKEAIRRLPDRLRLPVLLYYFDGYSHREIGTILGATQAQVKTRVRQGREKLKAMLTGAEGGDGHGHA